MSKENKKMFKEISFKIFFIDVKEKDYDKILGIFKLSGSIQLPVLSKGKIIGILDIFSFVYKHDNNTTILDICDKNYIVLNDINDSFSFADIYKNQAIIPFVDENNIYIGFVEKHVLINYVELLKIKCQNINIIQKFRDLEDEFETILESSSDGIHVTDGQGVTLRFNSACERIDGVKAEDIIGKNMKELVDCGIYSKSVALEVVKKRKTISVIQKVRGKEIVATGAPVFKNGEIVRIVINSRDITELNKLKEDLKETQFIKKKFETEIQLLRYENMKDNNIIIKSNKMKKVANLALRVAKVDSTILIQGESGVGKDVLCKFIHRNSSRNDKPFIKIDCGSIPENLLESELFGYERGAFTGANKEGKIGLIELADEGTLFLDEIGELPLNLQTKLLRVIQDRELLRIGGKESISVDVRIITATNRDLYNMVKEKKFREDLYYRLNVIPISIPPLRERREDIQPLIACFVEEFNKEYNMSKKIKPEVMRILLSHDWPGNIREVRNIIERLMVISSGEYIEVDDLSYCSIDLLKKREALIDIDNICSFKEIMGRYEKEMLIKIMKKCNSTKEMANMLNLDTSTIRKKFKKYKIDFKF